MNLHIITEYPLWFVVFCLLAAAGYAYLLYRNDSKFDELSLWKIRLMAALRFVAVFFIAFLLLSPLVKSISQTIEKPIIVVAQDNSESVLINKDSSYYKTEYLSKLKIFRQQLQENYDVNFYSFGEKVQKKTNIDFSEKQTDFSALINEIKNRYVNRNVGALVVAGDGIYNQGVNPVYSAENINFPIYTVALGDTSYQKDAKIAQVKSNKIAFLGNLFPLQLNVEARKLSGKKSELKVFHNGKAVFSEEIIFSSDDFYQTIHIEMEAEETGIQRYKIKLLPVENEISLENNTRDIVVDVIDSKQKILILSHAPHPDIGAMKTSLQENKNLEVQHYVANRFNKKINEYNLVILHQLPSKSNMATNILSEITKSDIPVLFILGTQSSFAGITNLSGSFGFKIRQRKNSFDDAQVHYNKSFPFFEFNRDFITMASDAPPIIVPFGNYSITPTSEVLFYQKIKNIETNIPLLFFDNQGGRKIAFLTGEGLWRWRMYDYKQNNSHDLFNEFFNKIAQYLSLRVDKENFVVNANKIFNENEMILFSAEVYNESYELVDDAQVNIDIVNSDNKKYTFAFKTDPAGTKNYTLNAGIFPIDDYTYTAKAQIGDKTYTKTGKFSVIPINLEAEKTVAQHNLLFRLATLNNGAMYFPAEFDELLKDIESNKEIVPVSYSEKSLQDFVHFKWLFFAILLLLSIEWFLRKFWGSY